MQIDLTQYSATQFSNYLSNTAGIRNHDLESLENLASQYPYCQIIHAFIAKAAVGTSNFDDKLEKAAIYATSRVALYSFINEVAGSELSGGEFFNLEPTVVTQKNITETNEVFDEITEENNLALADDLRVVEATSNELSGNQPQDASNQLSEVVEIAEIQNKTEEVFDEITEENNLALADDLPVVEVTSNELSGNQPQDASNQLSEVVEIAEIQNKTEEVFDEITEENNLALADDLPVVEATSNKLSGNQPQDASNQLSEVVEIAESQNKTEEVFDEITEENNLALADDLLVVEVTSNELSGNQPQAASNQLSEVVEIAESQNKTDLTEAKEARSPKLDSPMLNSPKLESPKPEVNFPQIETYDHHDSVLIKEIEEEAITAINQQEFITTQVAISLQPESPQQKIAENLSPLPESSQLKNPSLYNDDKLPFTFLWWLNKTRKEHYQTNQPYVNQQTNALNIQPDFASSNPKNISPQLNHQIAESILQMGAIDNYKNNKQQDLPQTKEDHIIKKFISHEPQIKPLSANKIDSENKAKLSSADNGELVSETLAKIYVEQMLYIKALETYRKLSLKYPEKSIYFASQIKYLELKVN